MARRHALATQVDITRAVRAALAAGLTDFRVVMRPDGLSIETTGQAAQPAAEAPRKKIVL